MTLINAYCTISVGGDVFHQMYPLAPQSGPYRPVLEGIVRLYNGDDAKLLDWELPEPDDENEPLPLSGRKTVREAFRVISGDRVAEMYEARLATAQAEISRLKAKVAELELRSKPQMSVYR